MHLDVTLGDDDVAGIGGAFGVEISRKMIGFNVNRLIGVVLSLIPPVRRWLERVLRRRFFALACLVTFFTLLIVAEDWRGWNAG